MMDSTILPRRRCLEILASVEREARSHGVRDVEATLNAKAASLTRFANNTIHQNVSELSHNLSVRTLQDQRTARASTNRLDEASIRDAVQQAVAIMRSQQPDSDLPTLADFGDLPEVDRFDEATAACSPAERAKDVAEAIRTVESASQTAAGIYATNHAVEAILNSRGLCAYYPDTRAEFSITAAGGDSSGWAKASSPRRGDLDPLKLARRASAKCALSANPRELPPDRYTVILEPAAVLDIVGQIFWDFSATAIRDQRSFLTGRLGEKLFGANITISDDVLHPLQAGAPFDGEGTARKPLTLVNKGIPKQVAYCRRSARIDGAVATGHGFAVPNEHGEAPTNIVFEGGDSNLEEMVASTERGILVTRLWYIREVDLFKKIMTGMTRDGTFLVEGGEVVCGVRNFRFNQSVIEMLSNVTALSQTSRASGEEAFDMVVPAMVVRDFNFSEVTRF